MRKNTSNIKWVFRLYLLAYYVLESRGHIMTITYGFMGPVYYALKCLSQPDDTLCDKIISPRHVMSGCGADLRAHVNFSFVAKHQLFRAEKKYENLQSNLTYLELTLYGTKPSNYSDAVTDFVDCVRHSFDRSIDKLEESSRNNAALFILFSMLTVIAILILLFCCSNRFINGINYVFSQLSSFISNAGNNHQADELHSVRAVQSPRLRQEEIIRELSLEDLVSTVVEGCWERVLPDDDIILLFQMAQIREVNLKNFKSIYGEYGEEDATTATTVLDALHKIRQFYVSRFRSSGSFRFFDETVTNNNVPFAEIEQSGMDILYEKLGKDNRSLHYNVSSF